MLNDTFTSTGVKFFAHQEAMEKLRNGKGQPIVTHVMLTDVCNHTCAFCSVQHRAGDSLPFETVTGYLETLIRYGLKAVILSGGGNPILWKRDGKDFNDVVDWIHSRGLEIGLITNGMPVKEWHYGEDKSASWDEYPLTENRYARDHRTSWIAVKPSTLDKLTWVRISMAGLDHMERDVYVPDVDPNKTALGFSYVAHDIYSAPEDRHHGKVSTLADLGRLGVSTAKIASRSIATFNERICNLTHKFASYCDRYKPRYLRLLPNCLEPHLIEERCKLLWEMADDVNKIVGSEVVFVQYKPPAPPKACYLGYVHPVLNCDGYVYPCDSCVLNESADHQFGQTWRVCRWDQIGGLYDGDVHSLIADTAKQCPGCVFTKSNEILTGVVNGTVTPTHHGKTPEHVNFV